jgi:RNA polymerase sigma-70 factor (ECF subfamily)
MNPSDPINVFVERITSAQQGLFAFILTLVPNLADAHDVLQETNLVLCRNREEYRPTEDFWPWAKTIARYQVLAHLKRQNRSRLRFGESLLAKLASEAEGGDLENELHAMDRCIQELPSSNREMLQLRYSSELSVAEIAGRLGRSVGAIYDAMYRIRGQLADCIQRKVRVGGRERL